MGSDTKTQGNWKGVYGADGYSVSQDTSPNNPALPTYAAVSITGNSDWVWEYSTADVRAPLKAAPNATDRLAACWYSSAAGPGGAFDVDVNLTDGQAHRVSLYCLDWDGNSRIQSVTVKDAATGAALDTEAVSGFNGGAYLTWSVKGHVVFHLTDTAGANAVLNALFFDPSTASATFVGTDAKTQGNWKGAYGADGYSISQDSSANNPALPAYATVNITGNNNWVWQYSVADIRAPLKAAPGAPDRLAACWYSSAAGPGGAFDVDVNLTDGQTHRVSLYCLDWDGNSRVQSVTVQDAASSAVLSTQSVSGFGGGTYLTWAVKGHVVLHITDTAGANALLNALFFDSGTASAAGARIDSGSTTPYTDTLGNVWSADQGFTGGTVEAPATPPAIANTPDPKLYQTQRAGNTFSYALPVANGNYILGLSFAEIDGNTQGQRLFNVTANGTALLTGFDVFAAAGGANKAVTKSFLVKVTGGQLPLVFTGTAGQAAVAAISLVVPTPAPDIPPPGWAEDVMPSDDASDAEGTGPAAASSVNLASGVEENSPGADLAAYNPVGPSASYERRYRSARAQKGYASPGLSAGWTDGYDLSVVPTGTGYTLTYDNGGQDQWTGTSGSLGTPAGAPYLVNASNGTLMMTFKDRSKYTFTQVGAAGGSYAANTYLLTGIKNLVGHAITLNRDTAANGYRLLSVTNDASPALSLLTFAYDGNGNLHTVTDAYNRQITYGFTGGLLGSVSPVAAINTASPVWRWQYGYTPILGVSLLNSVMAPDPSNPGTMAAATTTYDPTNGSVSQHQDAAGRVHSYGYSGGQTTVQVANVGGGLAESWTQNQNAGGAGKNADTGTVDAAGKAGSVSYAGTPSPYLPSAATNRNGQTAKVTYNDLYGNVLSATSPRNVVTTLTYGNPSDFPLNQVASVQESHLGTGGTADDTKQPTSFTYYGPADGVLNGLLKTVTAPRPDTTQANPNTAPPTTYSYDSLGNVTQTTGPNANGTMTVTYNYTSDGSVSQAEALGEPLSVTVNGPDAAGGTTSTVTHFRYDNRGNRTAVIDALGNETDFVYNLADQLTDTLYPATGDSGPGRAKTTTAYQYLDGPASGTTVTDENNAAFRQVSNVYDADGELLQVLGDTYPVLYAYDGRGRVSSVTYYGASLMSGHVTNYDYDTVGNLAAVRYPGQSGATFDQTHYVYDADGNVAQEINGVGVTKTYSRVDAESLLTGITYAYPTGYSGTRIGSVSFGYDHWGRRVGMGSDAASKTYTYDDLDELRATRTNFGYDPYYGSQGPSGLTLAYGHYPDGSRGYWQANGGAYQSYQYDGLGRLTLAYLAGERVHGSAYTYLPNGWLSRTQAIYAPSTSSTAASYLQVDHTYNPRGLLTGLTNSLLASPALGTNAALLSSFSAMTYDPSGNRLGETAVVPARGSAPSLSRTVLYGYDRLDEMTGEASTSSVAGTTQTNTFAYDLAGNPTSSSRLKGTGFNADNQNTATVLPNGTSVAVPYDGDGDPLRLTYQTSTYAATYDPEDRLTTAVQGDLNAGYDGDGLRAWNSYGPGYPVTGDDSYYLYDGSRPVVEEAYTGEDMFFSLFGATGLEGRERAYAGAGGDPTQIAYSAYTYDPQGNLVQPVTLYPGRAAGAMVRVDTSSAFDGFGAGPTAGAEGQYDPYSPVGFGGQWGYQRDWTGLYLLGHRYYEAGAGRFVNRDPVGYKGGINLYGYTGNNPVNNQDPTGFSGASVIDQLAHGVHDATQGIVQTLEAGTSVLEAGTSVLEAGTHLANAGISATENAPAAVISVAGAIVTSTYRDLKNAGMTERHHIIQDKAVNGLPGYSYYSAPAIQRTGPNANRTTPHGRTRTVQQQLGGGNFAAEVRIGYKALRESGMQIHEARGHIENAIAYFSSIGVGPGTPTAIPRDRKNGFRKR